MFQGFTQGTTDFLWGIRFNNERGWFLAHKEEFQTLVDTPLRELASQVSQAINDKFPNLQLNCKVSRIYRDARRLYGRGPYKDHLWFGLRRMAPSEGAEPGFYFEVAPEYYSYGMGCWDPTPVTMAKLRARIDRDPEPLKQLARRLEKHGEFTLEGQMYKCPKGDPGRLLYPWYNRRQISLTSDHNCDGLYFSPQLADQVVNGFTFLMPYYDYLCSVMADPAPEQP